MIANAQRARALTWQPQFLHMLPHIERYATIAFRHYPPEAHEEAVQESVCNSIVVFVRLWQLDRVKDAFPSVVARLGVAQSRDGRSIARRRNSHDVLSWNVQRRHGFQVDRPDHQDDHTEEWQEVVVEDKRAGPADVAAMRLDFAAWLRTLSRRACKIAKVLATGETTSAAARLFGLTPGRISQVRRELCASWHAFQGEVPACV